MQSKLTRTSECDCKIARLPLTHTHKHISLKRCTCKLQINYNSFKSTLACNSSTKLLQRLISKEMLRITFIAWVTCELDTKSLVLVGADEARCMRKVFLTNTRGLLDLSGLAPSFVCFLNLAGLAVANENDWATRPLLLMKDWQVELLTVKLCAGLNNFVSLQNLWSMSRPDIVRVDTTRVGRTEHKTLRVF